MLFGVRVVCELIPSVHMSPSALAEKHLLQLGYSALLHVRKHV